MPAQLVKKNHNLEKSSRKKSWNMALFFRSWIFFIVIQLTLFQSVLAQNFTKHALLIGIGKYPSGSGFQPIHGDKDVELLREVLLENGFYESNITRLTNERATASEILLAFRNLATRTERGDLVFIHFSGHFQQISDLNGDEMDLLDEAFVAFDGQKNLQFNYQGEGHLTDDYLARSIKLIEEKVAKIGQIILFMDGGLSEEINPPKLPYRGTQVKLVLPKDKNSFRGLKQPESYENEWIDFSNKISKDHQNLTVFNLFNKKKFISEVTFRQDTIGPLTSALIPVIASKTESLNIQNATRQLELELKKYDDDLQLIVSGDRELNFLTAQKTSKRQQIERLFSNHFQNLNQIKNIYTICIGVSNYKEPNRRLHFAHSDAQNFFEALKTTYSDRLKVDSLSLLLNEKATQGQIFASLENIKEKAGTGDVVYFYFAGHGDVEGSLITKPTFLLLRDGPEFSYSSGGHIPIDLLKNYFSTFLYNGAHVFMTIDACRAGNLAGGENGGTEAYQNIQNLHQAATKLLGCQPHEKSMESEVFGGGYGAFTWYLLKGISGQADYNKDKLVTVAEIGNFLKDSVSAATAHHQNPIAEGFASTPFIPSGKFKIKEKEKTLTSEQSLYADNQALIPLEKKFYASLKKGQIKSPVASSALQLLNHLEQEGFLLIEKRKQWRSDLAEAVLNRSQYIINQYIDGNESLSEDSVFRNMAIEIDVWLDLKSPSDPLFFNMLGRKYFFQARAMNLKLIDNDLDRTKTKTALALLKKSLSLDNEKSAHTLNAIGRFFQLERNYDSAIVYFNKAIKIAPRWKYPYNNKGAAFEEYYRFRNCLPCIDSAKNSYLKAIELDGKYALALKNLGGLYLQIGDKDRSKPYLKNAIYFKRKNPEAYNVLADIYRAEQKWDSAQSILEQGLDYNPDNQDLMVNLGNLYIDLAINSLSGKDSLLELAREQFIHTWHKHPTYIFGINGLINAYWFMGKYDSSAFFARLAIPLDTSEISYVLYLLEAELKVNDLNSFEKSIIRYERRFPEDGIIKLFKGAFFVRKKNMKVAYECFRKAKELKLKRENFEELEEWAAFRASTQFKAWKW